MVLCPDHSELRLSLASAGISSSYDYRSFRSLDHAFGLHYYGATAERTALAGQKCSVDIRGAHGDDCTW